MRYGNEKMCISQLQLKSPGENADKCKIILLRKMKITSTFQIDGTVQKQVAIWTTNCVAADDRVTVSEQTSSSG